jgi:hypothetical protein
MGKEQPVQSGSADHGEPAVPAVTGASGETATMEQPERVPLSVRAGGRGNLERR